MYNNEFELEFEQGLGYENGNGSYEFNQEFMGQTNGENYELYGELDETQELEFAHELLNVSNEEELNMFLGKLIKRAGRAIGKVVPASVGKGLIGALKGVAKKALPLVGGALGTVGGPLGATIGGKLGGVAGNLFELELEGLSPEDQEYELARAYVRFANSAANNAASLPQRSTGNPQAVLKKALTDAAQQHAPGLLQPASGGVGGSQRRRATQGSWVRRGNTLVIQL
ncbi:hypothetical protein [Spirosoma sp.]|uniref:hypothetical protein n=1 Tax=Spirosoma sp. TaxID=1899569 RepID=UPI003B3BDCA1